MKRLFYAIAVVLGITGFLANATYASARRAAAEGKGSRVQTRALIALGVVAIALVWIGRIPIPDTPGSPGALVFWFAKGGALLIFGIIGVMAIGSLIGARSGMQSHLTETPDGSS